MGAFLRRPFFIVGINPLSLAQKPLTALLAHKGRGPGRGGRSAQCSAASLNHFNLVRKFIMSHSFQKSKEGKMQSFTKLSPEEVLSMAINIEGSNASRYSVWADRFRPYNPDVSKLLDELAEEEQIYQKRLSDIFKEKYGEKKVKSNPVRISKIVEDSSHDLDHFFVTDESMGKRILLSALKSEFETFVFFKQALLNTKDEKLAKLFNLLADFEEEHIREIRDSFESKSNTKA